MQRGVQAKLYNLVYVSEDMSANNNIGRDDGKLKGKLINIYFVKYDLFTLTNVSIFVGMDLFFYI